MLESFAMLLLAAGGAPAPAIVAQLSIRQQFIVRVPTRPLTVAPTRWKEKGGPKCIPIDGLAGAQISREGVDLLLRGGTRVRAKLSRSCPPLDFYSGFYIRPGADGRVCKDRDTIRVRSGGACEIETFRSLLPAR